MENIAKNLVLIGFLTLATAQKAVVKIVANGEGSVDGVVYFTETADNILITGNITGLTPGSHGFHVHAIGDISGGCASTGAHFNPKNVSHGGPDAAVRHVGDLGNIQADETGLALINFTDSIIALSGENNIIGRGIVVHADADDLGLGNEEDSKTTGHAGARVGCGVIETLSPSSSTNNILTTFVASWVLALFTALLKTL